MSDPITLLNVSQIRSTRWLGAAQFRLHVKHSIVLAGYTLWSWEEAYVAGEEDLPGAWEWYRVRDKTLVTRLRVVEALDGLLRQAIRDRKVGYSKHNIRGWVLSQGIPR